MVTPAPPGAPFAKTAMSRILPLLAAVLAFAAADARAFCVFNELKDKSLTVVQEEHPDWKRQDARFQKTIKPGTSACCEYKSLDCNPNGRQNSLVGLAVDVEGEPALRCGPVGVPVKARQVKVSGDGTIRVVPNPKADSAAPYVARVWTHDKQDVTGPSGLPCR